MELINSSDILHFYLLFFLLLLIAFKIGSLQLLSQIKLGKLNPSYLTQLDFFFLIVSQSYVENVYFAKFSLHVLWEN